MEEFLIRTGDNANALQETNPRTYSIALAVNAGLSLIGIYTVSKFLARTIAKRL